MAYWSVMRFSEFILIFIVLNSVSICQDSLFYLTVRTNAPNSYIFINENLTSFGEIDTLLLVGEYRLKIVQDIQTWDSDVITDEILCFETADSIHKEYYFKDRVFVETEPANANVIMKDSLIGHTPLFLTTIKEKFLLEKENFLPVEFIPFGNKSKIILEQKNYKEERSFFESHKFKILLGSLVTLGAIAAYYKIEADENFNKYQKTNDNHYLSKTDRFDLISGISFGLLQVNFGYLIYSILTE